MESFSDPSLISLHNPFASAFHFFGLELIVYLCFGLTLWHAISRYRAGEPFHMLQWVVVFLYGLMMELISFNYFQNYAHATFSVQFYHGLLPLYVTCIYLVFHYTGIKLIERLRLPLLQEGLLAGLAIMLLDVPFDTLGVDAGWWTWADNAETALHPRFVEAVETRWFGTPVTSYYWYLMYGALLTVFTRFVYGKMQRKSLKLRFAVAPLISISVVVAGALAFELMFWTPRAFGASDDAIVAVYLAAVLGFALLVRAPKAESAPAWLFSIPLMFYFFHMGLLFWLWSDGRLPRAEEKLLALSAAMVSMFILVFVLPTRKRKKPQMVAEDS